MADSTPKSYHTDPTLWLYTSLTAGSSQIISATSRLEGILKANKIPFRALDVATDEKARMLWGRRAGKRKLPGLVRMGMVIGDFTEIDEWNEFGELKENIGPLEDTPSTPTPSASNTPSKPPIASSSSSSTQPLSTSVSASTSTSTPPRAPPASSVVETPLTLAMRQAGQEAAKKASTSKSTSSTKPSPTIPSSTLSKLDNSAPTGMPPPTGTTSPSSAIAPETGTSTVTSKADKIPPTPTPGAAAESAAISTTGGYGGQDGQKKTEKLETTGEYTKPRGSKISGASIEAIKALEQENMIEEEPAAEASAARGEPPSPAEEDQGKKPIARSVDATVTEDSKTAGLQGGGKKTQEQEAASPANVGESLAD